MTTMHAWFSFESALTHGSSIFRKPSGSTVNVTRSDLNRRSRGVHGQDEKYLGEVISSEDGGCVRTNHRVDGISGPDRNEPDRHESAD